jgi:Tfp pilus assembly protein PilP
MRSVITLVLGILIAAAGLSLQTQTASAQQATKPGTQLAAKSTANPPAQSATKPAAPAAKSAVQATGKPATKPATKAAMKAPAKAVKTESAEGSGAETENKQARRDPFESLVARQQAQKSAAAALPPGKAGLQVSTLRLDGIVRAPNGMIAVVTNPQARTYFLREGDQLYDGRVDKIAMDGVSFHELGKDAFGKPVERQVNKRIYSSAGEQQ